MELVYVIRGLLKPILKPLIRLIVGLIAIPLFRIFMRKVVRLQTLDAELEKDLEEWFRGSLLLLIATANMEHIFFDWVPLHLQENYAWVTVAFRIMLAISVVETMPDQELFSIIHPGPPKIEAKGIRDYLRQAKEKWREILKGMLCQHINRSSPVFAIMAAIFGGVDHSYLTEHMQGGIEMIHDLQEQGTHVPDSSVLIDQTKGMIESLQATPNKYFLKDREGMIVGWVCYFIAIIQYLIIGLVTSKDKALDVLSEFDRKVAERRREIIDEFAVPEEEVDKIEAAAQKEAAAEKSKKQKQKEEPEKPDET